jgi:outer membrane lipoprotein carrier protein
MQAANQGEKAEGLLYFQKPCRMRWQYESPPEQKKEIVADGREVWMFIPQDGVVMVYPLNQVLRSDLVMRFFSGMGELSRDFQISWNRPPVAGASYVIDLFPRKSQAELKRLTLTINPRTFQVERLEFANSLGEETRFAFSRMDLNIHLEPGFFIFTPPPGVQVVRENRG